MLMMLCTRQFKTFDQLRKHNKGSDLHKVLFSSYLCRKILTLSNAIARRKPQDVMRGKANTAQAVLDASGASASAPKYRDRASGRSVMHNQPDAPLPERVEDKSP